MVNRFIKISFFESIKRFTFVLTFLSLLSFSEALAQCNNIQAVSFTPIDTVQCGFPATVNFNSNVALDSTPVLLSTATSSPSFQSFFSLNFPTANNGCFYYLEISGIYTIWDNSPGYYDAFGFFNINSNQFISEGTSDNFSHTPYLFLSPDVYNPDHVYQYYYQGDGSTINVSFTDDQFPDNSGSMTFDWYVVPCFEYLWDFGDNSSSTELNPNHTYSNPGTYPVTLTITDLYNGCSDSFNSTVTVNTAPIVDLGEDTAICNNEILTLDATTPNATYQWQDGSNNPTFTVSQSDLYWVDVTADGCTSRDSINVDVLNNIVTDISTSICQGDVVTVGNSTYTATGFYTDNLTSAQGCDSIVNLDLTVISVNAVINSPLALDCNNATVSLDGNGSTVGSNITYLWLTQGGNIINGENTPNPEVDVAGLYQLIITYDDGSLTCAATDTVTVFENVNAPIADAGIDQTLNCTATTLILDGSNSSTASEFTYQWSSLDGNIVSGNTTLNPLIDQQGVYTLVVTNEENGCTASDSVEVDEVILSIADFNILFEAPTCFGNDGLIEIQALTENGPYLYSIDGGTTYYNNPFFDFLSSGDYSISIKDSFNCEINQAFYLPVAVELSIQLEPEVFIQFGESYNLNAEVNIPFDSIFSITWEPAVGLSCDECLDPLASPVETTDYTISIVDNNGCLAQAQVVVEVKRSRRVFIPNAFSPVNRDGNNDVFRIYTSAEQVNQVNSFKVFDRWGSLVYEANAFQPNDPLIGWDGTFNGKTLQNGVFVYYVEIEWIDGKVVNYKGDVSIIN